MGITGAIIFPTIIVALGLSVWGVFNRKRSIPCALAGIVIMAGASLGALHAWGEGQSVPWTVAYLTLVLIGAVSLVRQLKPRKQELLNAE
jgi:hypothetical protein